MCEEFENEKKKEQNFLTFWSGDLNPGFLNKFPPKIWILREIRFIEPGVLRTSGLYMDLAYTFYLNRPFSYLGAGYQLPKVQAESLVLIDSKVKLDPFTFRVHVDEPSLTFKVKLINSNVTWKLIFFPANFIETFLFTFSCMYSKTFFIQLQFLWKLYYYLYVLPKKLHSPWNSLVLCGWIQLLGCLDR